MNVATELSEKQVTARLRKKFKLTKEQLSLFSDWYAVLIWLQEQGFSVEICAMHADGSDERWGISLDGEWRRYGADLPELVCRFALEVLSAPDRPSYKEPYSEERSNYYEAEVVVVGYDAEHVWVRVPSWRKTDVVRMSVFTFKYHLPEKTRMRVDMKVVGLVNINVKDKGELRIKDIR